MQIFTRSKKKHEVYEKAIGRKIGYICVNSNGELLKPDYVTHKFGSLLKKNKLEHIRFHDLRHCCLSMLANNPNFTMKQVQEYAGHANYEITMDTYSHVDISDKKRELDALTDMIMDD